jgi:hypothetical protein
MSEILNKFAAVEKATVERLENADQNATKRCGKLRSGEWAIVRFSTGQ